MIDFLQAMPATQGQPQPGFMQQYSFIIMIALMVLVLWLFMWRPEAKRRKQMQAFRDGLKKGDKIITAGGIYGTVKEVKETTLLIEVDGNVTLRIDKNMVCSASSRGGGSRNGQSRNRKLRLFFSPRRRNRIRPGIAPGRPDRKVPGRTTQTHTNG